MHVESVNIGTIEEVQYRGRTETTAIFKRPTTDRIDVTVDTFGAGEQLTDLSTVDRIASSTPTPPRTWRGGRTSSVSQYRLRRWART